MKKMHHGFQTKPQQKNTYNKKERKETQKTKISQVLNSILNF